MTLLLLAHHRPGAEAPSAWPAPNVTTGQRVAAVGGTQAVRMGGGREGEGSRRSDPLFTLFGDKKGLLMELEIAQRRHSGLVTCSLSLRVRRGSEWTEADAVIRELRTYELPDAPHLQPAVCDYCADAIFDRRANAEETIAA